MREKFRPQNIEIWSTLAWLILYILQTINASKGLGGNTMAEISATYEHLLLPHPIARYIWWILALFLAFFVWAQFFEDDLIRELKIPFIRPMGLLVAVLGIIWLVLYQADVTLVALIFGLLTLFFLFLLLMQLLRRPLLGKNDIIFRLPISLLMGWGMFIWLQNLMILLTQKVNTFGESQLWSILLLIIGTILFISLATQLKDLPMAFTYILGYILILINHFGPLKAHYIGILIIAVLLTAVLIVVTLKIFKDGKKRRRQIRPTNQPTPTS